MRIEFQREPSGLGGRGVFSILIAMGLGWAGLGCGPPMVFMPTDAVMNGGLESDRELVPEVGEEVESVAQGSGQLEPHQLQEASIKLTLKPTVTELLWSARPDGKFDHRSVSNEAIVYIGEYVERVPVDRRTRRLPLKRPKPLPNLQLGKYVFASEGWAADTEKWEPQFHNEYHKIAHCNEYLLGKGEPLVFRLIVQNVGNAIYQDSLEIEDQLPPDVRYLGIRTVKRIHDTDGWGVFEKDIENYVVQPTETNVMGPRFKWSISDIELKPYSYWLIVDILFDVPKFGSPKPPGGAG